MLIAMLWKVLFWAWIISEVLVALITHTRQGNGKIQDRGSLLVLWVVIFGSIYAGEWTGATNHTFAMHGAHWTRWAAVLLLAIGLLVRWSAILTLGRSFSVNVAIHESQTLHKTGLFRYMRHPSYTGMLLIFFALGLATRNWLSIAIILALPLLALLYRIRVEEAALSSAFGAEYVDYSRVTRRLLPGIY
jgi:protein-S-isoprenylcysteine O-methyltransferase Ste14